MIYVTGDTHGDQILWDACIHPILKQQDIMIVAGDFGVGFFGGRYWSEQVFYDYLAKQPYTVLFCDGNHENFQQLMSYPVITWNGGRVHCIRPNVLHLMRGEVYMLEGKRLFVLGGGYSLDKNTRIPGYSWWPEEMPSQDEYEHARRTLAQYQNNIDFILTHTCPSETVSYMATLGLGIRTDVTEEYPLTAFLEYIRTAVRYKKWYFGHFHIDRALWRNQYALFHAVRELESGEMIARRA